MDERTAPSAHLPYGPAQRAWRRFDRLVVAAFVVGLLLPGLALVAGRRPAAIENRPLLTAPPLTAGGLADGSWTGQMDAYLSDNIVFRPRAIRLRAEILWASGGTGTAAVVRGRDGWLFLGDGFTPRCTYTVDEQIAALRRIGDGFAAGGQDFRFLVVPDKHTVYPERVDLGLRPTSCSETGRSSFRAGLASLGPFAIDGWTALEAERDAAGPWTPETSLYFRKDSHWTPVGATAAIRALVQAIDPDVWAESDAVRSGTASYEMDLARLMGLKRRERVTRVVMRPGTTLDRGEIAIPPGMRHDFPLTRVTTTGDRPTLPGRTLIIYDSFFARSVALVAPFFADSTWLRVDDLTRHPELVDVLGPFDRVIMERVERALYAADFEAALQPLMRKPE